MGSIWVIDCYKMQISTENLQDQIPYYLTQDQKQGLTKALDDFMSGNRPITYYINQYKNETLQGDGWDELQIVRFKDGKRKNTKGIILSNTCDISLENKRDLPANIVFAPIISLQMYENLLTKSGLSIESIDSKIEAIRKQKITAILYLPKEGSLKEEYIAVLDDLHTIPLDCFNTLKNKDKIFTLSMVGFYLFLFKISVHFCRFHENIVRC